MVCKEGEDGKIMNIKCFMYNEDFLKMIGFTPKEYIEECMQKKAVPEFMYHRNQEMTLKM